MRVCVGDVELYVHERGVGRPLVALHGGPGLDGSVWFPGLDHFAAHGYRVLAPDLRANGRSESGDPARWTVPQMADDVEALIGALSLDDAVVIGWSFGSFVAQSHMVRHGTAAAYVLMGTVSHPGVLANVEQRRARPDDAGCIGTRADGDPAGLRGGRARRQRPHAAVRAARCVRRRPLGLPAAPLMRGRPRGRLGASFSLA